MLRPLAAAFWMLLAAWAVGWLLLAPEGTVTAAGGWLRLDAVFALVGAFVLFISALVLRFSDRFLDGEEAAKRFGPKLSLLAATVLLMLAADHTVLFALAWLLMGLQLAALVGYRRGSPQAKAAGRLVRHSLLAGSALLAGGLLGLSLLQGSPHFSDWARPVAMAPLPATAALLALLGAAVVQCGLFPAHRWLLSSMTAPTPVSAFMHAGIVNAGGILLLRAAPVLQGQEGLMLATLAAGALSAALGSLFALIASDIKRALAASTMAQMGFMILQCGLGFPAAAVAHLILHGLFKASLFLAAGSAVRAGPPPAKKPLPQTGVVILGLVAALAAALLFAQLAGKALWPADSGTLLVLVALWAAIQAAWTMARWQARRPRLVLALPVTLLASAAVYGALVGGVIRLLASVPASNNPLPLQAAHIALVVALLALAAAYRLGWLQRSARLYAWLTAASRPAAATVAPHRSLHHA